MDTISYEDLCQKLQNGEIDYLEYLEYGLGEDAYLLYSSAMNLHSLPKNSETARKWILEFEEKSMKNQVTDDEFFQSLQN